MTADYRALCAEMLEAFDGLPCETNYKGQTRPTVNIDEEPFDRARAALAAEPVGEEPTEALVDDLFNRFADSCDEYGLWSMGKDGLRAALARWTHPAAPPAPEPGEVGELVKLLQAEADDPHEQWLNTDNLRRAATLLQQQRYLLGLAGQELDNFMEQQAAPAPVVVPVPVSERLPGEGDCDAEGRCWWFNPGCSASSNPHIATSSWRFTHMLAGKPMGTHWLPAHAIPLPQAGEVSNV
jgi:hypothetical protein